VEINSNSKKTNKTKVAKNWFEWPANFEDFKNLSTDKLMSGCRLCNVNVKYFPTTKNSTSFTKTRNMLLADLLKFAKKRYNISTDEVNTFLSSLNESKVALVKPVVNFKIDIKKLHIQEKNMLIQQIKSLKVSIDRKKETITRLSASKNANSTEIYKINFAISEFSEKLKKLEISLEEIQDIKKFEEMNKKPVQKQEIKNTIPSSIQKKPKISSSPTVISIIVNAVVKIVAEDKNEGWKVVKKEEQRNIKVCESVIKNVPCRHGDKCRFSHTPIQPGVVKEQLKRVCESVIKNVPCRHGDKCRFSHIPIQPDVVKEQPKRVCESVIKNVPCRHGDKCRFSHNIDSKKVEFKSVPVVYAKTKVCESVIRKIPCRHGDRCRYAHTKDELIVKKCDFDYNCRNYDCIYKHSFETLDSFYIKSGL
jgi:hypothetical protein